MPLNRNNCRTFHRRLFAGQLVSVTLLKRKDDQQQGTVTAHKLFECRRDSITKTGEPIQGEMSADERTVWHIPRTELDRVGVAYLNALDRIVDYDGYPSGRYWQPEAGQALENKLFETRYDVACVRVDPPKE